MLIINSQIILIWDSSAIPDKITSDGTQLWYQNGKRHRDGGPAIIYPEGSEYWYQNGDLHRIDGPAVVYPGGSSYWYKNGIENVNH